MKYVYFVAYETKNNKTCCELSLPRKIQRFSDVKELINEIEEGEGETAVITNYILLRKEKEEKPIMQEHCEWCSGELKGNYLDNECVKCGRSTDFK
jgi:hypothetical protein